MRNTIFCGVGLLGILTLQGCVDERATVGHENTTARCKDRIDNDGDGQTDCDDDACASLDVCDSESELGQTARFRIFLLLGQSNMVGFPAPLPEEPLPEDTTADPRVQVLGYDNCESNNRRADEWAVATPPLHGCGTGLGPGDYFAKTLIMSLRTGDTIGLVPCAIPGERIETFMKDEGSKYEWIIERAGIAQQSGGTIDGILFHQGESNNIEADWPQKVARLVSDLKADLDLDDIPFVAGELLYTGSDAAHNILVRMLPDIIPNALVVSAEGLVVDPRDTEWHAHFDHDSQIEIGKRYAEAMIEALESLSDL